MIEKVLVGKTILTFVEETWDVYLPTNVLHLILNDFPFLKVDRLMEFNYKGGCSVRKNPVYPGEPTGRIFPYKAVMQYVDKKVHKDKKWGDITFYRLPDENKYGPGWIHNHDPLTRKITPLKN
eukprot:UN22845